jgi:DNA-binding response OmpR family regulator
MARILVVDDDKPTRRLINLILIEGDHEIHFAELAQEVRDELAARELDLIVLDLMLPDIDGLTLYHQIRSQGYEGPVLALTASDRQDSLLQEVEKELGPTAVLLKPFDPDELGQRVELLLHSQDSTPLPA